MKVYKTVRGLQNFLKAQRKKRKKIGFVPTMGALHQGHLELVKNSKRENDITVVSIFVNPTQFDNKDDLKKYPRILDADANLLKTVDCDVLFAPSVTQVYPKDLKPTPPLNLKGLDQVMEGEFRDGHFDGVVQVVKRLLDIVNPHRLYMGQKDFQQFSIIQFMLSEFNMKTKLVVVPIIRETNGLAMSSRNRRMNKKQQEQATAIYKTLVDAKSKVKSHSPEQISKSALRKLKKAPFKAEYFQIVDGYTLKKIKDFKRHKYVVACTAVWAFGVRLIDNMILKAPKKS